MRWATLYLRSRRVPAALAAAAGGAALMWTLWSLSADLRGTDTTVLTILLLVAALTATLGGPDDALERTAGLAWPPRRAAHLVAAFLTVVALVIGAGTLVTGDRFAAAGLIARAAAGLIGLTALGAAVIGTPRAWFLPLGWTLAAVLFPRGEPLAAEILTWQAQPVSSTAAAVTAGVLAAGGLIAYTVAGPARRAPAEAAQQ